VAALYTLCHYADPRAPIREARRVLHPGGLFAACTPNRDSNPEAAAAARTLDLRLTLAMRGCFVYATKAL
jgi:2-polyprenyl-3-methyl-5-hydroxy-6-metoxy-1,4-benzoquinol methylase